MTALLLGRFDIAAALSRLEDNTKQKCFSLCFIVVFFSVGLNCVELSLAWYDLNEFNVVGQMERKDKREQKKKQN